MTEGAGVPAEGLPSSKDMLAAVTSALRGDRSRLDALVKGAKSDLRSRAFDELDQVVRALAPRKRRSKKPKATAAIRGAKPKPLQPLPKLSARTVQMRLPVGRKARVRAQPRFVPHAELLALRDRLARDHDTTRKAIRTNGAAVDALAARLAEFEEKVDAMAPVDLALLKQVFEQLRGTEAKLELGLREVRVKHVPELDDEFAKDTGDAETLEELKTKISDDLRKADGEEAEREARRRLLTTILEGNEFEPAPSMVAREVAAQVEQTKRQLAQQGMRLEHMGTNEQQYASRIRPEALFNVKAFLLLDAIGKKESIEVADEDVQKRLAEMAEESGQNVDRMKASMEKSGQLLMIQAGLREERIFDFLMEKAEVTEAPDPEPEGHDHDHEHGHEHEHDHG